MSKKKEPIKTVKKKRVKKQIENVNNDVQDILCYLNYRYFDEGEMICQEK